MTLTFIENDKGDSNDSKYARYYASRKIYLLNFTS